MSEQSVEEMLSRARILRQKGENKKAIAAYKEVLEAYPDCVDALNEMGLIKIKIGEQDAAIEDFNRAIALRPDDPRAYSNRAEAFLTVGAFEEALDAAKNSLLDIETDVLWFQNGMKVESEKYDVIVNTVDPYAHGDKRIIDMMGSHHHPVLIDFVRGRSAFDTLAEELGCRKIGGNEWMTALSLSIAHRWLGAEIDCDAYETILKNRLQ